MRLDIPGIRVDDLASDSSERGQGHDVGERVVDAFQANAQNMAIDCLEPIDRCAVVELGIGFRRLRGSLVEANDLPGNVERVRRPVRRIDEALDRVDIIIGYQLAALALERGIVGKDDSRPDPECVRPSVVGDFRERRSRERKNHCEKWNQQSESHFQ